MKAITKNILRDFLKIAGDRLGGDWVILGGSVLPLVDLEIRVTTDIDIAGPDSTNQTDLLMLMEIADELGLGPEAINQAGAYFLRKIRYWEKSLVLIHKGKKSSFSRPNINLFVSLKIQRFSEADFDDCKAMIEYAKKIGEKIETKKLKSLVEDAIKNEETNQNRIKRLRLFLSDFG